MTTRHTLRLAAAAAALAALAASGARAAEATQWNPGTDTVATVSTNTDASLEPAAWTVGRGEATEFRDAIARDTMTSRAAVRQELEQARSRRLLADAGEAGATDGVWQRRASYVTSERDAELAQVKTSADPIAAIAAMEMKASADPGAQFALAPDDVALRLPANQTPHAPTVDVPTVAMAPLSGEQRYEGLLMAEGPRVVNSRSGTLADAMIVEAR